MMAYQAVTIERYAPGEEAALWQLYFDTTHFVLSSYYTPEQIQRWAPSVCDSEKWSAEIRWQNPFVARLNGLILGFAELESDGHIDHFYVRHDWQRRGVGRALYEAIEAEAVRLGLLSLYTETNTAAMPLFASRGFAIAELQEPIVCGSPAKRYIMKKALIAGSADPDR